MSETPMYQMKMTTPEGELILPPVFTIRDPLRWTTEKPAEPGWYWWTDSTRRKPTMAEVYVSTSGHLWVDSVAFQPCELEQQSGQWAGPIPQPTDQPGEAGEANGN